MHRGQQHRRYLGEEKQNERQNICGADGCCRLNQEGTFQQAFAASSATLGCFHLVSAALARRLHRLRVFPGFCFLLLTNNSANDSEVVTEILVDALLLNQTGLWNASQLSAGLSAQHHLLFIKCGLSAGGATGRVWLGPKCQSRSK